MSLCEFMWITSLVSQSLLTHPIPSFKEMYYSFMALLMSEVVYISQDSFQCTVKYSQKPRFLRRCLNWLSHHLKGKWPSTCWNSSAYSTAIFLQQRKCLRSKNSNYLSKPRHSKRAGFFSSHLAVHMEIPEIHTPFNCRCFSHEETKHISQNCI